MNTKIGFILGLVLLAGCENAPPGGRAGPYVKPGLVVIPADQAHLYGVGAPSGPDGGTAPVVPRGYATTDVRSVQTESPVTAIQFNRYADPARPDELMHEAHMVYRREAAPRWRLQPASAEQQILVGPSLTDGRGEVKPLASQELDGYLREQRANLQKQQQVMGQVTEGMRQLAEQQQQLAKELATLRAASTTPTHPEAAKATPPEVPPESAMPPSALIPTPKSTPKF